MNHIFQKIKLLFIKTAHEWSPWSRQLNTCIETRRCAITHKVEKRTRHHYDRRVVIEEEICPVCAGAGVEYDGNICIGCAGACMIEVTNHYTSEICSRCGK